MAVCKPGSGPQHRPDPRPAASRAARERLLSRPVSGILSPQPVPAGTPARPHLSPCSARTLRTAPICLPWPTSRPSLGTFLKQGIRTNRSAVSMPFLRGERGHLHQGIAEQRRWPERKALGCGNPHILGLCASWDSSLNPETAAQGSFLPTRVACLRAGPCWYHPVHSTSFLVNDWGRPQSVRDLYDDDG